MHASRIVTFLLGGWLFCTLGVDISAFLNLKLPERVLANPAPVTEKIVKDYGPDQATLLLRHFAAEGNRYFFGRWERTEILLGILLIPCLYFATDRKPVPLILAGFMLIIVCFQYFALSPELAFRGREADFPPGMGTIAVERRVWLLTEVYIGTEAALVLVGGVLAIFMMLYKSRRRVRSLESALLTEDVAPRRV